MEPWIWAVLLWLLGMGLAVLEVFLASGSLFALLSVASLIAAVAMGFYQGPVVGTLILVGVFLGVPTVVVLALQFLPKTAMGRRVLLFAPNSKDVLPDDPDKNLLKSLIGRTGRAKSKLLLSGVITVDGRTVDAVSESMPVEVGQMVEVIQVRGRRLVVRPIVEGEASASPPADPLQRVFDDPFDLPRLDSDRP
jgi:membrane-bound ClpP family serine protease